MLPKIIVLLIGFILLLLLLASRVPISISIIVCALVVAAFTVPPNNIPNMIVFTAEQRLTQELVLLSALIAFLVVMYEESGQLAEMTRVLSNSLKRADFSVMAVPAFLGLLSVPGGALMSAPVVEKEGSRLGLGTLRKIFVNMWFRHLIFMVYPLDVAIIIAAGISGVSLWQMILYQAPIALFMILIGYLVGIARSKPPLKTPSRRSGNHEVQKSIKPFLPILGPVAVAAVLGPLVDDSVDVYFIERPSLVIGAVLGIALLMIITRPGLPDFVRVLRRGLIYDVILATYGALLLSNVMVIGGIASSIIAAIESSRIPFIIMMTATPVIIAFITGSPITAIAISVPIVTSIQSMSVISASMIFVSSFLGHIASPLHLCYVFSATYFKGSLTKSYALMIPSCIATMLFVMLLYGVLLFPLS
ncbi:MAG: DUF401 family protein [Candidatus Baldrarchaeia archaeon]